MEMKNPENGAFLGKAEMTVISNREGVRNLYATFLPNRCSRLVEVERRKI